MQKKFIALAVAGAMAAPFAASADKANVEIFGKLHVSWDFVDSAGADNDATGVDRASRIGFKGAEDLGNGMKAIWHIETDVQDANWGDRPVFAGLTGDFGTFAMGRQYAPYKVSTGKLDMFGDTIGDYNAVLGAQNPAHSFETYASAVAYVTPTVNGFHAAIARGAMAAAADNDVWSMAAVYSNGPLYAALAYETHDGLLSVDADAWKAGIGYSFGNSKVGFVYENIDDDNSNTDTDNFILNFGHKFGANTFKIQYGDSDVDNGADADYWAIGLDHAFSKRTKVYAVYADAEAGLALDSKGWGNANNTAYAGDVDAFSFGLVHKF